MKIPSITPTNRHTGQVKVGVNRRMRLERAAKAGATKIIFLAAFHFLERDKYAAASWMHIRTIGTASLMQLSFTITDKNLKYARKFNLMCDRADKIFDNGN